MKVQTSNSHVKTDGGKTDSSQPILHQHGREIQPFGTLRNLPIALATAARSESCKQLNQIMADSIILSLQKASLADAWQHVLSIASSDGQTRE